MENAAAGNLLAVGRYEGEESINLGSGMEISIKDLAEKICRLTGLRGDLVWDTVQPNGRPRRCLGTSRARALFGVHGRTPFEERLRRTVGGQRT